MLCIFRKTFITKARKDENTKENKIVFPNFEFCDGVLNLLDQVDFNEVTAKGHTVKMVIQKGECNTV